MGWIKDLGNKSHSFVKAKRGAIPHAGGDAGTLLAPVLKGKEAVVGQKRCILMAVNGKDAAFMFGTVGFGQGMWS
jgi:hypothetical protein